VFKHLDQQYQDLTARLKETESAVKTLTKLVNEQKPKPTQRSKTNG
jgi:hypothetical protein